MYRVGRRDEAELARLLQAALAGDERAYADFSQRGRVAGARLCPPRRIVHGGIDPEDIVQETLLAIHLKRHTWRDRCGGRALALRHRALQADRRLPAAGRRMEIAWTTAIRRAGANRRRSR